AQVHQAAHIVVGGVEVDVHKGLFLFGDLGGVGVFGGVGDGLDLPVGEGDPVLDAGGGGDKVEVELPLQPRGDDLHVQKAEKAAPEAEAQGRAVFGLVGQGGVVQLQLFQGVLQVGIALAVGGVDAAEHHRLDLAVAGQSLGGGVVRQGDGVTHPGVLHRLDAGGQIAHLPGGKLPAG